MYDKCYFCLDQLPKLKKEIHSKLFRKFWRSRGTKEPAYITVQQEDYDHCHHNMLMEVVMIMRSKKCYSSMQ